MMKVSEAKKIISSRLSPQRYQHSLQVAQTAREMAKFHGGDGDKAYLVGILHDYAKDLPADKLLACAGQQGLIEDEIENRVPDLLHAPVGACLLALEQGLDDPEMLEAVRAHTLGSVHMSTLDKIIFLADMIEPSRGQYPDLACLRRLCYLDLDAAMLLGLESTIRYCLERAKLLHPRTVEARNAFLLGILKKR